MGLLSRIKRPTDRRAPDFDPADWIGRKFRSNLSVEASVENFYAVIRECYRTTGAMEPAEWRRPATAAGFVSSQGNPRPVDPIAAYRVRVGAQHHVELAVWDGVVSYGDGTGGPPIEMWFVYSDFDRSVPTPVAGTWKMRDASLSSIGWVERPLWGLG